METVGFTEKLKKVKEEKTSQSLCWQFRTAWEEYRTAMTQEKAISLSFEMSTGQETEEELHQTGFVCGGSLAGEQLYVFSQTTGSLTAISTYEDEATTSVISIAQAPNI